MSVLHGCAVIFIGGLLMVFCQVVIFKKVAILMICTSIFTFYNSIFVFASCCMLLGPNGTFGDLKHYLYNPMMKSIKEQFGKLFKKG